MMLFDAPQVTTAHAAAALEKTPRRRHPLLPALIGRMVSRRANDAAWDYSYAISALPSWHPLVERAALKRSKWTRLANSLGV